MYICESQLKTIMNKDMTNEDYHADTTRIGKSGLDLIAKSPAHYWAKYLDPNREKREPTAAMQLGTAVHHAILEPHEFERRYQVMPEINKRTNDGKAEFAALMEHAKANGITFLGEADKTTCLRMRDAVHKHPAASALLVDGEAEKTLFWNDQRTGAKCKCRPDWLSLSGYIADIKTTADASSAEFAKSVYNYRYHVQAPWYLDGYEQAFGRPADGFAFIAVENEPPYAVAVYYVTQDIYDIGKRTYMRDLDVYMECLRKNQWPGYSQEFQALQLPAWAK